MVIEGKLSISLTRQDTKMTNVDIQSSRPLKAVSMLEGKKVEETLDLLPLLFSVCATAQAGAAIRACQNAIGRQPGSAVEAARDILITMEMVREHLWRISLDWPKMLAEPAAPSWAALLSGMLTDTKSALFGDNKGFSLHPQLAVDESALKKQFTQIQTILESEIFAVPLDVWLENRDIASWRAWSGRAETPAARLVKLVVDREWGRAGSTPPMFLPQLDEMDLQFRLSGSDADRFVAHPDWHGQNFETTSLARQNNHPLISALIEEQGCGIEARLAAKLVELASIKGLLQELSQKLSNDDGEEFFEGRGDGVGQVEAARGRLVHWVRIKDDRVDTYRILAPTEWNFHPEGAVARGLMSLPGEGDHALRKMAELLIETIDPCVGYELTLH